MADGITRQYVITETDAQPELELGTTSIHMDIRWTDSEGNLAPDYQPNPEMKVYFRWDGCCHIYFGDYNAEEEATEFTYLHVDDLNQLIADLTRLRDMGREFFSDRPRWPDDWQS